MCENCILKQPNKFGPVRENTISDSTDTGDSQGANSSHKSTKKEEVDLGIQEEVNRNLINVALVVGKRSEKVYVDFSACSFGNNCKNKKFKT